MGYFGDHIITLRNSIFCLFNGDYMLIDAFGKV